MGLKVIFAGTPEFATPTLQALIDSKHEVQAVFTQPDRPKGRGNKLLPSSVKQLAIENSVPVYQPTSLKDLEVIKTLEDYAPDIIIVAAYGLLVPGSILSIPKGGCINVHASVLPDLRGAAPIQYAILNGLEKTGITIMQMDKGLDTGAMLKTGSIAIDAMDTAATLSGKLSKLGAKLLLDTLHDYENNALVAKEQDNCLATHAPKIDKAMAKIDWQKSAIYNDRLIRALNPNPIAFTEFNQLRIKVLQGVAIAGHAIPGQIVSFTEEGLDVGTKDGILRITQCQLPGKKPQTAKQLLNGYQSIFKIKESFN